MRVFLSAKLLGNAHPRFFYIQSKWCSANYIRWSKVNDCSASPWIWFGWKHLSHVAGILFPSMTAFCSVAGWWCNLKWSVELNYITFFISSLMQLPQTFGSSTPVTHATLRRSATQRGCTPSERGRLWSWPVWSRGIHGHRWGTQCLLTSVPFDNHWWVHFQDFF